ncbi:MAG TPA: hemerythrin domain-containing protein [Jiangellaceae bacterium]|jgi:hemerythrin superfamily protein|nr:hemerythrin domain-containing protein [Jiangellaceae bacterium]
MTDVVDLIMEDHREVERLFELLKTQPDQRPNTLPVLSALLIAHSRAEEAEVYPVAQQELGNDEVTHSQEEHIVVEQLLERLETTNVESNQFDTLLEQLEDAVNEHVEEEESSVLPAMREQLDQRRRDELGAAFAESRAEHLGEMPGEATKEELIQQAKNLGLGGAQAMEKDELRAELQKRGKK